MRTALIFGASGQDGAYLSRLLMTKGYRVVGVSRHPSGPFHNFSRLGIDGALEIMRGCPQDIGSVRATIGAVAPDEIYNLAGQSSVGRSFLAPAETVDSIVKGSLNILEVMRERADGTRFYNAGSSECFGDRTSAGPANEESAFRPLSPYAAAKAAAVWQVKVYRSAYDLFACSGLLFNHESPLRPERFVTRKIVRGAVSIAAGVKQTLRLGDISIARDWGWAPDYVEAMWQMLQQDKAEDFVIATGETHRLEAFVAEAFDHLGLDWREHVESDPTLYRPSELKVGQADPSKAKRVMGWTAKHSMADVARAMVEAELNPSACA